MTQEPRFDYRIHISNYHIRKFRWFISCRKRYDLIDQMTSRRDIKLRLEKRREPIFVRNSTENLVNSLSKHKRALPSKLRAEYSEPGLKPDNHLHLNGTQTYIPQNFSDSDLLHFLVPRAQKVRRYPEAHPNRHDDFHSEVKECRSA